MGTEGWPGHQAVSIRIDCVLVFYWTGQVPFFYRTGQVTWCLQDRTGYLVCTGHVTWLPGYLVFNEPEKFPFFTGQDRLPDVYRIGQVPWFVQDRTRYLVFTEPDKFPFFTGQDRLPGVYRIGQVNWFVQDSTGYLVCKGHDSLTGLYMTGRFILCFMRTWQVT